MPCYVTDIIIVCRLRISMQVVLLQGKCNAIILKWLAVPVELLYEVVVHLHWQRRFALSPHLIVLRQRFIIADDAPSAVVNLVEVVFSIKYQLCASFPITITCSRIKPAPPLRRIMSITPVDHRRLEA